MKFKTIKDISEIHRIIKTDTMIKNPFRGSNMQTDWIDEELFTACVCEGNTFVGFIENLPTMVKVNGHCMMIQPIGRKVDTTTDAFILGRMSELLNYEDDGRLDDDNETIAICETDKNKDYYFVRFYYGRYIGK